MWSPSRPEHPSMRDVRRVSTLSDGSLVSPVLKPAKNNNNNEMFCPRPAGRTPPAAPPTRPDSRPRTIVFVFFAVVTRAFLAFVEVPRGIGPTTVGPGDVRERELAVVVLSLGSYRCLTPSRARFRSR
eukprot:2888139-Prymnesium_polylepis.2